MIFITGTTGFVGKSIQNFLRKRNYNVVSLDIRKDLYDFNADFNNSKENILIHAAWAGVLGKDRNNNIQDDNLKLTYKVLNLIDILNIKKIISFGSQAEYGPCNIRVSEDQPLNPSSYYGVTKIKCFDIFNNFFKLNQNKDFIWLRLFDPYGPGDNLNWFIPYVIRNALLNKSPSLTECSQKWDYLYIYDICKCLEKIINSDYFLNGRNSNIYNLCSDEPVLLKNIVEMIFQEIKPVSAKPLFGKVAFREDQQHYLHGNNTKICKDFSWSPEMTLKSGLSETIKFFKEII